MNKKTYCIDVGGPTSAIDLSKQSGLVAIVGKSIFKIYAVGDFEFEELTNLRVVKSVNPSFNDVAWNQVDENILASAATNGTIVIWNLAAPGFSKMGQVFQDHKRNVNKICFHGTEPSLLISGSQDSIKLFDLRENEAVITFSGLGESVRDLKFCPHRPNSFIAVLDNGYIQLYDVRKKDRYEQRVPGHNGPILSCDWHPDQNKIFATAGRDMSIKIWSAESDNCVVQHSIPTMESVSKVKWSYDNSNYIASCSLKRDYSINVWDVNRPYIAAARFNEPKEVTIGMSWNKTNGNLISASKDGILYQLPMIDAHKPVEHANPICVSINPNGDVALAIGDGLSKQYSKAYEGNQHQSSLKNNVNQSGYLSKFEKNSSQRSSFNSTKNVTYMPKAKVSNHSKLEVYKTCDTNWFVKTAEEYQLSNKSLAELCDHNARVSASLQRFQVCQTWKILKLFFAHMKTDCQFVGNSNVQNNSGFNSTSKTQIPSSINIDQMSTSSQATGRSNQSRNMKSIQVEEHRRYNSRFIFPSRPSILNESPKDDVFIEDYTDESIRSDDSSDEWYLRENLAYEAFQPKREFIGMVNQIVDSENDRSSSNSPTSNFDESRKNAQNFKQYQSLFPPNSSNQHLNSRATEVIDDRTLYALKTVTSQQYKFQEIIANVIADVLKSHVDNSDVQTAVSILIVLGDKIENIVNSRISQAEIEAWYHSYIELLSKYQLWNVVAKVINLSPLSDINSINQTSTTIYTTCGLCNKPMNGKVSWICERCQSRPSECSICHGFVNGVMSWCQGCYHGGHLVHMSEWFKEFDYCPTGCGHLCELGQWSQTSDNNCIC